MLETVMLVRNGTDCTHARALAGRLGSRVVELEAMCDGGVREVLGLAAQIAEAAVREHASLIVVAGGVSHLAGQLLATAPCPVVVMPAAPAVAPQAA